MCYLSHVDQSQGQGLVAKDGSILVSLASLQHNLELVGVPLQEMWVLRVQSKHTGSDTFTGRKDSQSSRLPRPVLSQTCSLTS